MPSKSSPGFFGLTPATKHCLPLAYSRHMRVWNWPVLPVIPCVMTLVFLLTRMLISIPGDVCQRRSSFPQKRESIYMAVPYLTHGTQLRNTPCLSDHLLRRFCHIVGADDRQPRLGEYLAA